MGSQGRRIQCANGAQGTKGTTSSSCSSLPVGKQNLHGASHPNAHLVRGVLRPSLLPLTMSRLRVYPGDDGDTERDREAQWLALTPTRMPVFQPGDDPLGRNRRRTGLIYIHLRCNGRTQHPHGFDRCNRHITPRDHQQGYRYCMIQCSLREHSDVTDQTAWDASLQLARNWSRMRGTRMTREDTIFHTGQCSSYRGAIQFAPQDCHCDCAACLGPEPLPEAPVVDVEPTFKRVRRS